MDKIQILVIGRDEDIQKEVLRLINNNAEWNATAVSTDEQAIEKFHQHHFDIVLLTDGIDESEEKKLRKIFTHQDNAIIIIQNNSGDSGLLSNEILMALEKRRNENRPTYSFNEIDPGELG